MQIVSRDQLQLAVEALQRGEVIAIPTDTVYGLAAVAAHDGVAAKIFAAKNRPRESTLPVLVADVDQALSITANVSKSERTLMDQFWPGALTVVLDRADTFVADLGDNNKTVGVRCPASEIVRELASRVGPLATTSANLHGQPPCATAKEVVTVFSGETNNQVALVVDGGECGGLPSSVAKITDRSVEILREGSVSADMIQGALSGQDPR